MTRHSIAHRALVGLALLGLLTTPAFAAGNNTIHSGADLFATPANGETFVNFFRDPVPAGFFCPGSEPFTDLVNLRGVPLVTSPAGALGDTDTIMERLDDAVFDAQGRAITRVRVAALSLESIEPIRTGCGDFRLLVTTDGGPQPATQMQIYRTHQHGGFFLAPLELRVQLSFVPLKRGGGEPLVLDRDVSFPAIAKDHKWVYASSAPAFEHPGTVAVQSAQPGSTGYLTLPGTSNFAPLWGVSEQTASAGPVGPEDIAPQPAETGHVEGGHYIKPPTGSL